MKIKSFVVTSVLLTCVLSLSTFALDNPTGAGGQGNISDQIGTGWVINYDYAYGVRISLYDATSNSKLDSFNLLNKDPSTSDASGQVTYICLGEHGKTEAQSAGSVLMSDSMFDYEVDPSVPDIGTDPAYALEWMEGNNTFQLMTSNFGKPIEELSNGDYIIAFEPIRQAKLGLPSYTFIGTETEIARFATDVLPTLFQGYWQYPIDAEGFNYMCRSYIGNVTHHNMPSHYYIKEGSYLGFPSGYEGWFDFRNQISSGQGIGILTALPPEETPPAPVSDKVIPKDQINQKFVTDTASAHPRGTYDSYDSPNTNLSNTYDASLVTSGGFSGHYEFLGHRGATSNPTHLVVSKAYGKIGPQLNDTLKNIPNIDYQYEGDHEKDKDGTASVSLPSVTARGHYYVTVGKGKNKHTERRESRATASWGSYQYTAEPTMFEVAKSASGKNSLAYKYSFGNQTLIDAVISPLQKFSLSPSYKMKYFQKTNSSLEDIWMVASGIRTFDFKPIITINGTQSRVNALSPWSRDIEDINDSLNVTKAGNAIKITGSPMTYDVTCTYYLKDPFFTNGSSTNFTVNNDYVQAVEYIVDQLSTLHYFSNIPYTGDKTELIFNNLGINQSLSSDLLRKSLVDGLDANVQVSDTKISVVRSNFLGQLDSNTKTTFDSKTIPLGVISELSPAITKSAGPTGWYKEDYEGLIRVTINKKIRITPPSDQWLEVYRELSDWLSKYNDKDNSILYGGATIYSGNNFVLGYGYYIPQTSFGSAQVPEIKIFDDYYEFKIRGSAFDQA